MKIQISMSRATVSVMAIFFINAEYGGFERKNSFDFAWIQCHPFIFRTMSKYGNRYLTSSRIQRAEGAPPLPEISLHNKGYPVYAAFWYNFLPCCLKN
jgi:hypothetical protein